MQIAAATLSGNSLRQTVYTHRVSFHQAAKLVAALLKGHFTHMKLFFKITEIETLINITYIVRFLRSTDVSVFYY